MIKKIEMRWVGIYLGINEYSRYANPYNTTCIKINSKPNTFKTLDRAGRGICNHFKG